MVTKEHIVGCIAKPPVGTSSAPTPPTAYSILPNIFTLWISGFLLKTQNILQQFLVCTKRSLSQIYALTGIKFWFGRAIGLALWWHTERNSRSLSSDHMANQLPCNRHFSDLLFLAQRVQRAYCSWLHWEEVDEWQGCQGCQLCPLHITSRHPLRHSPRHIRNKNKNIENEEKNIDGTISFSFHPFPAHPHQTIQNSPNYWYFWVWRHKERSIGKLRYTI